MRYISSFSGIGLRVLTAKKTETIGEYTGTIWFTFLLLPIFPIKRLKIRPLKRRGSYFSFEELGTLPHSAGDILQTYAGTIGFFLVLFIPIAFAFKEIQDVLGIPKDSQWVLMVLAIVWLIIGIWKYLDWDASRWFK